jgi:hypothetical protein
LFYCRPSPGKFLSNAIKEADTDQDGRVSLPEFIRYYERLARWVGEEQGGRGVGGTLVADRQGGGGGSREGLVCMLAASMRTRWPLVSSVDHFTFNTVFVGH